MRPFSFYEFFSGGGMARLGLGSEWKCLFANDFDSKKVSAYRKNFSNAPELISGDIKNIKKGDMPDHAVLAWASFPCQDLSLAGNGAGLAGSRSNLFWSFWNLILELKKERRNPPIIVIENVSGLINSHNGNDLSSLIVALESGGYRVGALLLDGAYFVAQSRPRLFIIAISRGISLPRGLSGRVPNPTWHPQSLQKVVNSLPPKTRRGWIWWKLPVPSKEAPHLSDIIESDPKGVVWHSESETRKILNMMTVPNLAKVKEAQGTCSIQVGTVYKRTRNKIQRAEVRFDGVSGCLRTPVGGSSRQIIMIVEGKRIRTRLIAPRETARLMGLPESYILPEKYNDAYHLTGDGVVVPAVSWLEHHILRPLAVSAQIVFLQKLSTEHKNCQTIL